MQRLKKSFFSTVIFSVLNFMLNASASHARDVWIVGTEQSPIESISKNILEAAFLGKPYSGEKITPIDRIDTKLNCRTLFYEAVVGKSSTQLKSYWSASIFTGKAYPPHSALDIAEVKRIFESTPNAVTFVDSNEMQSWMKLLLKIPTHS